MSEITERPGILTSASSEQALVQRIAVQEAQVTQALARYDARSAILSWFDNLRAIEDCINLLTVDWDDEEFEQRLYEMPVAGLAFDLSGMAEVRKHLIDRFSEPFANRFQQLLIQASGMTHAFALQGIVHVAAHLQTLGTLIAYLQSRRRHFVALLHLMPSACRGRVQILPMTALTEMLPIVEFSAIQMVGVQYALMARLARERLGLPARAGVEIAMLDGMFLEPERSRITEMPWTEEGRLLFAAKETLRTDRFFSAAELRNDIVTIEAAYAEFDLRGSDFAVADKLVRRLSHEHGDRDFWVAIPAVGFERLLAEVGASATLRNALIGSLSGFMACLSTYAPFVQVDGVMRSTVTLLSRFIYAWRARTLDCRKRYQIRAGFIFEDVVKTRLAAQGFEVQDIVRISRREFDVVIVLDGVIWNVQCKNNFVDLSTVDADANRFARYNRALVQSYEKALDKERGREDVLKIRLSLNKIQHMAVSRFPVVCENTRIVPFSRIDDFAQRARVLLAQATDCAS